MYTTIHQTLAMQMHTIHIKPSDVVKAGKTNRLPQSTPNTSIKYCTTHATPGFKFTTVGPLGKQTHTARKKRSYFSLSAHARWMHSVQYIIWCVVTTGELNITSHNSQTSHFTVDLPAHDLGHGVSIQLFRRGPR